MSLKSASIRETYTLPSEGKLNGIASDFTIRSMTTMEEKKRLGASPVPFKLMVEVINDCVIEPEKFDCYDLPIGDFQFLMHRLRVVTYGNEYEVPLKCPNCKSNFIDTVDLDKLEVRKYKEGMEEKLYITLPRSGDQLKLKFLSPRLYDNISRKSDEIKERFPDYEGSPTYIVTLQECIDTINGEKYPPAKLQKYVEEMQQADAKAIQKAFNSVDLGVNTRIKTTCKHCGHKFEYDLPITREFF